MKTTGIVLSTLGGLLIPGNVNVALTQYNLNNGHDLSKMIGGWSFAIILLAIGLTLIKKSKKNDENGK